MPSQITNYQCPACGGPLRFDGGEGKLLCDYCGSRYDVAQIEAAMAEKQQKAEASYAEAQQKGSDAWDTAGLSDDWGEAGAAMKAYNCPSCGAQLICDENTAATACPYCGNPTVVPGTFAGSLKPDYVIPFRLDKAHAKEALKKHYKGKKLLPRAFTAENRIDEIQGVYVPFWLFSGQAWAQAEFDATLSETYRSGDYEVTNTHHYRVQRAGTVGFERIPVDASSKMPDEYMDAIEPFDYGELKPFSTAYMPGFLADKYDVSTDQCSQRADERSVSTAVSSMRDDVTGYETCTTASSNVQLQRGSVQYAMLPVYLLNTKWNGKDYLFAMNGQTGRMVGDLPVSRGKWWAWFAGITVPLTVLLSLVLRIFL